MDLQNFISTTIYSIAKALQDTNKELEKNDLGEVWTKDLNTKANSLVNVNLVKGTTEKKGVSRPVLLLDYDVSVAVENKKSSGGKAGFDVNGKLLQIVGIGGKGEGHLSKELSDAQVQRLKFTVPIALNG